MCFMDKQCELFKKECSGYTTFPISLNGTCKRYEVCQHSTISWKYREGDIQFYECNECGKYIALKEISF